MSFFSRRERGEGLRERGKEAIARAGAGGFGGHLSTGGKRVALVATARLRGANPSRTATAAALGPLK